MGDGLFWIDCVEGRHVSQHAHLDHCLGAKNWANLQDGGEVDKRDVVKVAGLDALLLGAGFDQQRGPEERANCGDSSRGTPAARAAGQPPVTRNPTVAISAAAAPNLAVEADWRL